MELLGIEEKENLMLFPPREINLISKKKGYVVAGNETLS